MKEIFRSGFIGLLGLALATVVFEAALRLVETTPLSALFPVVQVSLYGPDAEAGYAVRPGVAGMWMTENRAAIEINEDGYRGLRHDHIDTLFLGDSYTEALQVETAATFVERYEQLTGRTAANFGLSGATPPVYIARLQSLLHRFRPSRAVIVEDLGSFSGEEMFQSQGFVRYRIDAERSQAVLSRDYLTTRLYRLRTSDAGRYLYWMLDHIRVVALLNNRINYGLWRELKDQLDQVAPAAASRHIPFCPAASFVTLWSKGQPAKSGMALTAFLQELRNIEARERIPIILVLTGPLNTCSSEEIAEIKAALTARAQVVGVDIVYLDPVLETLLPRDVSVRSLRGFRHRKGQGHLNEKGHDLYARAIVMALTGR